MHLGAMMSAPDLPVETPIPGPPPGPTYVRVEPIELAFRLFVTSVVVAFFVLVTIALRVWSRFYVALKLGWDDALVSVASVFSLGQTVLFGLLVFGGLGHHSDTVPAPNQFSIPKVLFSFELFHVISLNFAKLSALFLYMKLFNSKDIAMFTRWCIFGVSLGTIALILWQFLFCHPLHKMWEWDGLENCGHRQPLYVAVCAWSISTDLLLVAMPLWVIWGLKMNRAQKIRLSLVFTAGLLVTATSIVRLGYIITINYNNDFSYHSVPSTFLAVLEPPETIFCVSLPMIYSLFNRVRAGKTRPKSLRAGRHSHTYDSGIGGRIGPQKRSFAPLETTLPDLFEMNEIDTPQRQVMVSADARASQRLVPPRAMSVDRVAEPRHGLGTSIEEPALNHEQSGGIIVSKDFTVSVSHRQ